jgi:hypothetical protein
MLSFDGYLKVKSEKLRLLRGEKFTLIVGACAEVVVVMTAEDGRFTDKWRIINITSVDMTPIESVTFTTRAEAEEAAIKEVFGG